MGPLSDTAEYVPEDEPLLAARANAADLGGTEPVLPAVGAALRFLACAVGARTAVEIGAGCGRAPRSPAWTPSLNTSDWPARRSPRQASRRTRPASSSAARSTCSRGC